MWEDDDFIQVDNPKAHRKRAFLKVFALFVAMSFTSTVIAAIGYIAAQYVVERHIKLKSTRSFDVVDLDPFLKCEVMLTLDSKIGCKLDIARDILAFKDYADRTRSNTSTEHNQQGQARENSVTINFKSKKQVPR